MLSRPQAARVVARAPASLGNRVHADTQTCQGIARPGRARLQLASMTTRVGRVRRAPSKLESQAPLRKQPRVKSPAGYKQTVRLMRVAASRRKRREDVATAERLAVDASLTCMHALKCSITSTTCHACMRVTHAHAHVHVILSITLEV